MACTRTTFQAFVTRITAEWLNKADALLVALGCATTKEEAQLHLEIMTKTEINNLINDLQTQINNLNTRITELESCNDGYCIKVVAAMPAQPDPNTIYHVTG